MMDPLDIHALADNELREPQATQIQREVARDASLSRRLLAIQALKRLLQERAERYEADEVWVRCRVRLNEIDRSRKIEGIVTRYAWGLCGAFLLMIVAGGTLNRMNQSHNLAARDLPRVVSGMVPLGAPKSQSQDVVQRWIADVTGGAHIAPANDLRVVNGAVGTFEGRRVVRVTFEDASGYADLLILPPSTEVVNAAPAADGFRVGQIDSVNCAAWWTEGHTMLLLGDRSTDDLVQMARRIVVR